MSAAGSAAQVPSRRAIGGPVLLTGANGGGGMLTFLLSEEEAQTTGPVLHLNGGLYG
ncbi:MAG TPA: hypothetical protein VN672_05980 [Solirubrobacteraceae bacterium]|nr:hypothetical protein [Solirubrobacteraceae bacterium]